MDTEDTHGRSREVMNETAIDRPVFVVGVDHSGTSILYRVMARHPELAWLSQYSLRDGSIPGRTRVPLAGWINRTGRRMCDFTWQKRQRIVLPEPREGPGIWRRLLPRSERPMEAEDCPEEMVALIRAAIQSELREWQLDRIIFKIPYLTRAVLALDRVFPTARFVHIVRDGRAVALSIRSLFADKGRSPRESLLDAANYWAETLQYLDRCAGQLGDRMQSVRYEDFCADVHGSVTSAWRFCDLDSNAASLATVPTTLRPTNHRWLDACAREDEELLDETLDSTLRRWGYCSFRDARPRAERAPLEGWASRSVSGTAS